MVKAAFLLGIVLVVPVFFIALFISSALAKRKKREGSPQSAAGSGSPALIPEAANPKR